jgi:hypothetical protein
MDSRIIRDGALPEAQSEVDAVVKLPCMSLFSVTMQYHSAHKLRRNHTRLHLGGSHARDEITAKNFGKHVHPKIYRLWLAAKGLTGVEVRLGGIDFS